MIVVIPVCDKDIGLAIRNIEFAISMDRSSELKALISHEKNLQIDALLVAAKKYFKEVESFAYDPWGGQKDWPFPQNYAWQETARHIESKVGLPWFWWEADAVPLKSGWLDSIKEAFEQGKRPFCGAVTSNTGLNYMAGVAVYPAKMTSYSVTALLAQSQPWDISASTRDGILRFTHDITPLICHTPDRASTFFGSYQDVEKLVPETAVLFHKCKDGSLLDVLQGRPVDANALNNASAITPVPSVTEQTKWPCGIFAFPNAPLTCYFNPSIAVYQGQTILITRRYRWDKEKISPGREEGNGSDLAIFRVRPNMTLEPNPIIPTLPTRHPREQFEDPKAIVSDTGQLLVMCANWVHFKKWPVRQVLLKFSNDLRKAEYAQEFNFGGTATQIENCTKNEKNWNPFQTRDGISFVYTTSPHHIRHASGVQFDEAWNADWKWGQPRGGTPPLLVGKEYISFFHSSLTWMKPKRRYFMGVYAFSAIPPYRITRFCEKPLLTGSENDFRALGGPLVVFPNGAILRDDKYTVVFGINDEDCGWITIPAWDVDELLKPV